MKRNLTPAEPPLGMSESRGESSTCPHTLTGTPLNAPRASDATVFKLLFVLMCLSQVYFKSEGATYTFYSIIMILLERVGTTHTFRLSKG